MKITCNHKQLEVNEDSFKQFLELNDFKFKPGSSIMSHKGRLNVSWHESGYSILGDYKDYPNTMDKVVKRFAKFEPTWIWMYVRIHDNIFDMDI